MRTNFNSLLEVIVFPLVPHGQDRDGSRILDLEEGHVTAVAEGNQQLPESRFLAGDASTRERKTLENPRTLFERSDGAIGCSDVAFDEERLQAKDVLLRVRREPYTVVHSAVLERRRVSGRALSTCLRSRRMTVAAGM